MLESLPHSNFDILIATLLAFGTDRFVNMIWEGTHHPLPASKGGRGDSSGTLHTTFWFGATHSIAISARIYLSLLIAEIILERYPLLKVFKLSTEPINLRIQAPKIAIIIWACMTFSTIKKICLLQSVAGSRLGRVSLFDHLIDFIIYLVMFMAVLDQLQIDWSVGIQSMLSAGGIGALIFSLAAKDLAEQIVGGFALGAWDAFNIGDKVRLGDGTEGIVLEIGLLETIIQGWDNIITRIPNSQLTTARVSNLSRVTRSRLLQELRFKYSDLDKLHIVLQEIKDEIRLSCPKLINDGSKPFYAVLMEYEPDHIKGMIMAHFDIPPATADFTLNRQEFVMAIARATKKHNVTFALPSIEYHGPNLNIHNMNNNMPNNIITPTS